MDRQGVLSEAAAMELLRAEATERWRVEMTPEVEESLRATAAALAAVSAADVPDRIGPFI